MRYYVKKMTPRYLRFKLKMDPTRNLPFKVKTVKYIGGAGDTWYPDNISKLAGHAGLCKANPCGTIINRRANLNKGGVLVAVADIEPGLSLYKEHFYISWLKDVSSDCLLSAFLHLAPKVRVEIFHMACVIVKDLSSNPS